MRERRWRTPGCLPLGFRVLSTCSAHHKQLDSLGQYHLAVHPFGGDEPGLAVTCAADRLATCQARPPGTTTATGTALVRPVGG